MFVASYVRQNNSHLKFDAKHPVILPAQDHVVDLLGQPFHPVGAHTWENHIQGIIQNRFWMVSGKETVKRTIKGYRPWQSRMSAS